MSKELIWVPDPPVRETGTGMKPVSRRKWTLHVEEHIEVVVYLRDDEYSAQCNVGMMPILGKTFRGIYIGTTAEFPLEVVQSTALGKAYDEVSNVLQALERAMHTTGHEVEPLVPAGALDHRGRP